MVSTADVNYSKDEISVFEMVGNECCPFQESFIFYYGSTWWSWGLWTQAQN